MAQILRLQDRFRVEPVRPDSNIHLERHPKFRANACVISSWTSATMFALVRRHLEDQFVVNLQATSAPAAARFFRRRWMFSIATLIRSAAEP